MCNAFSCILKSDLSIVPNPRPDVHSHEAQARAAGILDSIGSDAYQRVECVPSDGDYASDPMTWPVLVDEKRRASWVDENWPEIEDRVRRAAARWIASRGIRDDGRYTVREGETRIVVGGRATIMVSGGLVCTQGTSSPTIIVNGGKVWTHGTSSPTITQSGGAVCTHDTSSPRITMSDGEVRTYGTSTPTITQSGGDVWTHGTSSPTITQSGGEVRDYREDAPPLKITRVAKE